MRNARNSFSLVKKKVSDIGPGILETFPLFSVSESDIIGVFVGNRTMIDLFTASIADVGSPIKSAAAFCLKIRTGLVTGGTGSTFNAAEQDLIAGIRFLTTETLGTEVLRIKKSSFVKPSGGSSGFINCARVNSAACPSGRWNLLLKFSVVKILLYRLMYNIRNMI